MIKFDDKNSIFYLETNNTSYIFGLLENKFPVHIHWGAKIGTVPALEDIFPLVDNVNSVCYTMFTK